jgi:hypothetical protein
MHYLVCYSQLINGWRTMSNLSEHETRQVLKVVRRALAGRYGGNTLKAAREMKVPQQTLWRLIHEPPRNLRRATFETLKVLDASLDAVVWTEQARDALQAWQQWVQGLLAKWVLPVVQRSDELQGELRDFEAWARSLGHAEDRVRAAPVRAVAMVWKAHTETSGIERAWGELTLDERSRFLRAALECERILLNRPPEDSRAREVYPTAAVAKRMEARLRWFRTRWRREHRRPRAQVWRRRPRRRR